MRISSNALIYCSTVHVYDLLSLFLGMFFRYLLLDILTASSIGITSVSLKNAACIIILILVAQADICCDLPCVNSVEINVLSLPDLSSLLPGSMLVDFFISPQAVEQERAALFQILQHIVLSDVCLIVAGYEIRLVDKVSGLDRMFTESQVRYCQSAGFLGVICEISLGIQVRLITDDLDGSFVRTYCTVRAQTPELTLDSAFRFSCDTFRERQRVIWSHHLRYRW